MNVIYMAILYATTAFASTPRVATTVSVGRVSPAIIVTSTSMSAYVVHARIMPHASTASIRFSVCANLVTPAKPAK